MRCRLAAPPLAGTRVTLGPAWGVEEDIMAKRRKYVSDMSLEELRAAIARYDRLGHVPSREYDRYDSIVRRIAHMESEREIGVIR